MWDDVIVFEWDRDPKGYRLVLDEKGRGRIVRQSRSTQKSYRVRRDLYRIFLNSVANASGLLEFMRRYGALTQLGSERGQDVAEALTEVAKMRDLRRRAANREKRSASQ